MPPISSLRDHALIRFIAGFLVVPVMLAAAACGGEAATPVPTSTPRPLATAVPTQPAPTSTPVPTSTQAPSNTPLPTATVAPTATAEPTAMAEGPARIETAQDSALGAILTDGSGRTLYLFTKDQALASSCSGGCASAWPPLTTGGAPSAGDGVAADRLATIERTDGSEQVTYNGWPLYYYAGDSVAGDVTGQDVNHVWFVVSPFGGPVQPAAAVDLVTEGSLAPYLVDASGRTLYLFTRDALAASNCSGNCALNWPPLLTTGAPVAGDGVAVDRLSTIERADGGKQVTYDGWPLYYYAKDVGPGSSTGQDVGKVWFVVSPLGGPVQTAAAVNLASDANPATRLVDASGRTLYLFTRDTLATSNCSGNCALNWPPLLTVDAAVAGDGVAADRLATIERSDGGKQVTYDGWPLYYYAKDTGPGSSMGQDVGKVWFVVSPLGGPVQTAATVNLATEGDLAPRLVDASGRTLYLFTKDVQLASNCAGNCALNWQPLLTLSSPAAGDGVAADRLATIQRPDGGTQVAYNGWPLYYYAKDTGPGSTTGENVGNAWYVVSPFGGPQYTSASVLAQDRAGLGLVLTDGSGRSLYLFTKDTSGGSTCTGNCALNWPPLLSTGAAVAGDGATAGLLGTVIRDDGSTQVTYNGAPLYYYARDAAPGDTTGQGVGGIWYLVTPGGSAAGTATPTPTPAGGDYYY